MGNRKRKGRPSNLFKLSSTTVSETWSKKKLQDYIRQSTQYINKSIGKDIEMLAEPLQKSIKLLKEVSGVKGRGDLLGLGLNKSKKDLLRQARMLHGHMNIDVYTSMGEELISEKEQQAYETFKERSKQDISFEDYTSFVNIMGGLDKTIIEALGSEQIRKYYLSYKNKTSAPTIFDLMVDIYNEHKTDIIDGTRIGKKALRALVGRELKKAIKKASK